MDDWSVLARESLGAAGELLRSDRFRSSISRSYYAAFAVTALRLEAAKTTFPRNWDGPSHQSVPKLVEQRLTYLPINRRRDLKNLLRVLYNVRIEADYLPRKRFERRDASEALKLAGRVFQRLELKP